MNGYIKQENRVVEAHFALAKKQNRQPEFVERKRDVPALRRLVEEIEDPAQVPPPSPKKPVQAALPLKEAPEVRQEGFTWNSSSEIE